MKGTKVMIYTLDEHGAHILHGIAYKRGIGSKAEFYTIDGDKLDSKKYPFAYFTEKQYNSIIKGNMDIFESQEDIYLIEKMMLSNQPYAVFMDDIDEFIEEKE